jgi:putative solute:sodium symporter small subunit
MDGDRNAKQMRLRRYWPRVRLFSFLLLVAWFLVTFFAIFYARELSDFDFFGWPVSFYLAAQGLVLFYLAVTGLYVKYMQRVDRLLEDGNNDGK